VPCSACGLSKRHLFDEAAARAATTWWSPVTTSTTRQPCCSATRCGGMSSTSPASCRCCRPVTGSRRRSSRSCASPSARWRRGVSSGGSTTRSRSARWRRQQAPGLQGGAQPDRAPTRRGARPRSTWASSSAWRRCWPVGGRRPGAHLDVRLGAARPPRARRARSVVSSSGWRARDPVPVAARRLAGAGEHASGTFRAGRSGPADRQQEAALPHHPESRRVSSTATPASSRTPISSTDRRASGAQHARRVVRGVRPTLEDFVLEMPRGAQVIYPKDLAPICMLADIGPGYAGARVRGGIGSPVDDHAALGRRDHRLRAARGLRQPGTLQRAGVPRRRSWPRSTTWSFVTVTRGSTRPTSIGWCSTCPNRGGWCRMPSEPCAREACWWPTRPASPRRFRCARRSRVTRLDRGAHARGPAPHLARGGQAVRPDHRMVAHTGFLTSGGPVRR
jgi:tRNA (adenine57-N1/adenine58-N1)-methyltransferase catalytic subunit